LVAASHVGERPRMSNVRKSEINGARPCAYWYSTEYFAEPATRPAAAATATYFECPTPGSQCLNTVVVELV